MGAILLARAGAKVLVVDIDREAAEGTAAMIAAEGGEAAAFIADVAVARWGRLDCLDNNVGIGGRGLVVDTAPADWRRIIQVNVDSMYYASRHAVP
ncbi:MAG TPA: SDR family oxidoreductase, partial [Stellaceae bacterium]|nr:SDR family oxidoreductase [Stellaceae bacterium]